MLPPGKVGRHHLGGIQPAFRSCLHRLCASLRLVSFGNGFLGFLVCKRHSFSDLWLLVSSSAFASDCAFCEIFFFFFFGLCFQSRSFCFVSVFFPLQITGERVCIRVFCSHVNDVCSTPDGSCCSHNARRAYLESI